MCPHVDTDKMDISLDNLDMDRANIQEWNKGLKYDKAIISKLQAHIAEETTTGIALAHYSHRW
jgi:hypothetical protein